MAKELPYFKFEPNQWENGNIQICSREDKGLFMDICSMYWSRLGDLQLKLVVNKLCGGNASSINSLIEENIIEIIDGNICIDFLNEQLVEFEKLSNQNRDNARKGWEKRRRTKKNANAYNPQSDNSNGRNTIREDKKRVEESREDKKKIDNILLSEINISDLEESEIEYFQISKAYQELFIKNLEKSGASAEKVKKVKYKDFTTPIRLMMQKDKITKNQLTVVFQFLQSNEGEFWKPIILSTKKLREKFDQLILKANNKSGKQVNNKTAGGATQSFREKTAKRLGIIQS